MEEIPHAPLGIEIQCLTTIIECRVGSVSLQGSGFFYGDLDSPDQIVNSYWRKVKGEYIITNRHVVLPKINNIECVPDSLTFNYREVIDDKVEWMPITLSQDELKSRLLLHPDEGIDVVAIDLDGIIRAELIKKPHRQIMGGFLTSDHLPNSSPLKIEVASDVIVLSYPNGFYDTVNKFPIIKSGIIASAWGLNFNGNPLFLIDAQLFPGSSGGLVLSKPTDVAMINGDLMHSSSKHYVFLGIYSGEPVFKQKVGEGDTVISMNMSFGLGNVWYWWLIPEIIEKGHRL